MNGSDFTFGRFLGYTVSAFALIGIGFTVGQHWTSRYRPHIIWQSAPPFDASWEFIDAGSPAALVERLNEHRPKPEHIIPVCGSIFRVWYRKDYADLNYKHGLERSSGFDSEERVRRFMNDPQRVVIGFDRTPALYYVEVSSTAGQNTK